ncbi:hypothetical protein Mesil_1922 [Allomeiothermus silvanus DSM 9946]|uniref:Uncharacterized protein n=1 Tax=Allomeiothermus silvanus (strain ATCC 700542 / DSM 9946 / NBRC 106475 / NCIMB 13440 / VI-R2) TaxID=526227 RepID=D7BGI1_ALLS1|nr:hypothetical protein [Allomeiothermus silvanus]ADH63797.1 hypothetical protein Mesil_1922 [Allomeiothermus silvanus DSM 9946]
MGKTILSEDLEGQLPPTTLTALRATHGDRLFALVRQGRVLVFRPLTKAEYRMMRADLDKASASPKLALDTYAIGEKYAKLALCYPDRSEFEAILDDYPGLADVVSQDLAAIAQMAETEFLQQID